MINNEYLNEVSMWFKIERARQRLTQRQLSEKSGLAQATINSIENGHESSGILTIKKIADGLGKPLSDFV